jgi:hypothetical protein
MRILKSGAKSGPFLVLSELSCPCAQFKVGFRSGWSRSGRKNICTVYGLDTVLTGSAKLVWFV